MRDFKHFVVLSGYFQVLLSIDGRNLGEAHSSPFAAVYVEGSAVGQVDSLTQTFLFAVFCS